MKAEYILFVCEHYNPLGIARSLGENGILPIGIIIKSDPKITSKSKFFKKIYLVDSIEEGYDLLIKKFASIETKHYLFSADDKIETYLDSKYDELKEFFWFFNAGEKGRVAFYMNKDNINKLALKHGLNVLPTYVVNTGEIPEGLEYPVITKVLASTMGAWKNDVFICNNEDELIAAYKKIKSPKLLLQKYIKKKNEYCMEGFSVNHGKSSMITIVSTYNYVLKDQYSPYMTCKNLDRLEILPGLQSMISEIGYEGIYEVEFLLDENDVLYFLEINFRNSTWSYASTKAGMPLPILWSKYMQIGLIDNLCLKKIKDNFTAMVEPQDFKVRVTGGKIKLLKWIKDFNKADCKYFIGKSDLRPVVYLVKRKIFNLSKRQKG